MQKNDSFRDIGKKRLYITKEGKKFTLQLSDEFDTLEFIDDQGLSFGEFIFSDRNDGTYKLMRMYTEPHNGCGLGRQALQFFRKRTNAEIYMSQNDGIARDDQSHLTGHALFFVSKMIAEGLIDGYENEESRALFLDLD